MEISKQTTSVNINIKKKKKLKQNPKFHKRKINQTSWRIHHNSDTTILPFQKKISHMAVKAFFPPPEDPAGMTFKTLNLTVFDKGLKN